MILAFLCGESPLARRVGEFLGRPAAALALLALAALLATFADALQGAL